MYLDQQRLERMLTGALADRLRPLEIGELLSAQLRGLVPHDTLAVTGYDPGSGLCAYGIWHQLNRSLRAKQLQLTHLGDAATVGPTRPLALIGGRYGGDHPAELELLGRYQVCTDSPSRRATCLGAAPSRSSATTRCSRSVNRYQLANVGNGTRPPPTVTASSLSGLPGSNTSVCTLSQLPAYRAGRHSRTGPGRPALACFCATSADSNPNACTATSGGTGPTPSVDMVRSSQ